MAVRDAQPDEIDAAYSVWLRAASARTGRAPLDDPDPSSGLRAAIAKPGARLLVGLVDGRIVATIYGVALKRDRTKAQVAMLGVDPAMWGAGIGTRMLTALTAVLREQGCTALRMNVDPSNDRARALYERQGWRHSGETETVEDADTPEVIYRLDLG